MPAILAIDTSSDACSVALVTEQDVIKESTILAPREHTQRILPMIQSLLADNEMTLKQLDAIAFGGGPGSFTGLRICISIAQGLAYGADLPLIAVSSLEAMAKGALRSYQPEENSLIIPVIDARMDEVYWSAYRVAGSSIQLELLVNHQTSHINEKHMGYIDSPSDCQKNIRQMPCEQICAIGSGWQYPVLQSVTHADIHESFHTSAYDIAELGVEAYRQGKLISPLEAEPTYLRNEISWQKRKRIRT